MVVVWRCEVTVCGMLDPVVLLSLLCLNQWLTHQSFTFTLAVFSSDLLNSTLLGTCIAVHTWVTLNHALSARLHVAWSNLLFKLYNECNFGASSTRIKLMMSGSQKKAFFYCRKLSASSSCIRTSNFQVSCQSGEICPLNVAPNVGIPCEGYRKVHKCSRVRAVCMQ